MIGRILAVAFLLSLFAPPVWGQVTGEVFVVAYVTYFDAPTGFVVIAGSGLKDLGKEVELDNRAMTKAYDNMRRDWREAHSGKTVQKTVTVQGQQIAVTERVPVPPFPLKRPPPRVMTVVGRFPSEEAANAKRQACEEKEAARLQKIADEEDRKAREADGISEPGGGLLKRKPVGTRSRRQAVKAKPEVDEKGLAELAEKLMRALHSVKIDMEMEGSGGGLKKSGGGSSGDKAGGKLSPIRKVKRMGE